MTYRAYITKNYKTGKVRARYRSRRKSLLLLSFPGLLAITAGVIVFNSNRQLPATSAIQDTVVDSSVTDPEASLTHEPGSILEDNDSFPIEQYPEHKPAAVDTDAEPQAETLSFDEPEPDTYRQAAGITRQKITVKTGDSLALIFSRLGLSPRELYTITALGKPVSRLKRLQPGQVLNFNIEDNQLIALEYEIDHTQSLNVIKKDGAFVAEHVTKKLDSVIKNASAVIKDSLFLSGKRAGLSDNLIMQLVSIYGWDIDFALDIREGDTFTLIYEEHYKAGIKVSEGPVIAAEFINKGRTLRAIRYAHADGYVDYYSDNGDAMRKAFLRTPVNFTRISSQFNLNRKHPILNKIRAHKGVDYAAPTGTPVKATGNGTVILAERKGGYGRTVILKHGRKYSTLYAHLHRYAKGISNGRSVKQGQIIGYVGKSGLATGPHLHYEFRVHGVHRNPLTVKLPKAESISKDERGIFNKTITPLIAELDRLTGKSVLAVRQTDITDSTVTILNLKDG